MLKFKASTIFNRLITSAARGFNFIYRHVIVVAVADADRAPDLRFRNSSHRHADQCYEEKANVSFTAHTEHLRMHYSCVSEAKVTLLHVVSGFAGRAEYEAASARSSGNWSLLDE